MVLLLSTHSLASGGSPILRVTMWCVLQMGHSGDGCVLASTLCKFDLR